MREHWHIRVSVLVLVMALFGAESQGKDGHHLRQWMQPGPNVQMDMDPTLVPVGRGAVFIPCMSYPLYEPTYALLREGETVGNAQCGRRIVAPPGDYLVEFGSGTTDLRLVQTVVVKEGKTSLVEPEWGGLRVQVVDDNSIPFRGLYELVAVPSMENYGVGIGAQVEQGENVRTWILRPGLYMLLKVGESYEARSNFYTVRVREGVLEQMVLVADPETGDFLGAGEMTVYTAGRKVYPNLTLSGVVGGGASLSSQQNITGVPDSTKLAPSVHLDFLLQYSPGKHWVYGRLTAEEAFTQEDWGRIEKNVDFLRVDGLYAYRLWPFLGPYARAGMESTLFPSFLYFDEDKAVESEEGDVLGASDQFRIADAFMPLTTKGGMGLRFNTLPSPKISVWALVGAGGRYTFTGNMFKDADVADTEAFEVASVQQFWSLGLESTIVLQFVLSRFLIANSEAEIYAPFDALDEPTLRWDNNLALRLTSKLSINYTYRLKYEPELNEDFQHYHLLQMRLSYKFL